MRTVKPRLSAAGGSLEVFGKAGLVYWNSDTTVSNATVTTRSSDDRTNVTLGVGFTFDRGGKYRYRAEAEWYDIDNLDSAWFFSVGASFFIGDKNE